MILSIGYNVVNTAEDANIELMTYYCSMRTYCIVHMRITLTFGLTHGM